MKENPDWNEKVVYLTFDDGPSENTGKILDILKEKMQRQPSSLQEIIGNMMI